MSRRHGIGVLDLLLVAFIVLKLCHVISWPWWVVLSPGWVVALLFILAVAMRDKF